MLKDDSSFDFGGSSVVEENSQSFCRLSATSQIFLGSIEADDLIFDINIIAYYCQKWVVVAKM